MVTIELERADDKAAVEALLDRAFGPERHRKTAQRLRDGQSPARGLSFVAREDGRLVGTLRFWPVQIGDRHCALLLGPVAVDPDCRGRGIGARLVTTGLAQAKALRHRAVILVGDVPYYERFGFSAALTANMILPGPVDRARFLALELVAGALAGASGAVVAEAKRSITPLPTQALADIRSPARVRIHGARNA